MKLSKAQLGYIRLRWNTLKKREEDLISFGEDLWKNQKLAHERIQISREGWFLDQLVKLHTIEVEAEKKLGSE